MTNLEIARSKFEAYDKARIEAAFSRGPAINDADYDYKHGWITVGDDCFNRDLAFPEIRWPRFPADQGCAD